MSTPQRRSDDVTELQDQIEHTRDELAGTVEALAHKADVRSRAGELKTQVTARTKAEAADLTAKAKAGMRDKPWLLPAVAAGVLALAAAVVWRGASSA